MTQTPHIEGILRRVGAFPASILRHSAVALLLFAVVPLLPAAAAEILSAQIRFQPPRPFVNQPFDIVIEVRVTPGAELQDTQIDGLPDSDAVVFENLAPRERRQVRENNQTIDILSFASRGRGLQPVTLPLQCGLRASLVERRSAAFFSHWVSTTRALRFAPATLEIQPLPAAGRPEGFGGAVGQFTLNGSAAPTQVQSGDIVTLGWELAGRGWLGDATLVLPDPGGAFKTYPPQETVRDAARIRLTVRQVVIPLTTNATQIGAARFAYFDPDAGGYRTVTAGPFALTFGKSSDQPAVRERRIELAPPASTAAPLSGDAFAARMQSVRRGWPLAAAIMVAALVAGVLADRHRWLALAAAVIVLGSGIGWQRHAARRQMAATWKTAESVVARLCPADGARALFDLATGHAVTPLETADAWVRINADGREGWIPTAAITKAGLEPAGR